MTAKAFRNKYALTINHPDSYQIKTASTFPTTIRLVGHDVVDLIISLLCFKLHSDVSENYRRLDFLKTNFFEVVVSSIVKRCMTCCILGITFRNDQHHSLPCTSQ